MTDRKLKRKLLHTWAGWLFLLFACVAAFLIITGLRLDALDDQILSFDAQLSEDSSCRMYAHYGAYSLLKEDNKEYLFVLDKDSEQWAVVRVSEQTAQNMQDILEYTQNPEDFIFPPSRKSLFGTMVEMEPEVAALANELHLQLTGSPYEAVCYLDDGNHKYAGIAGLCYGWGGIFAYIAAAYLICYTIYKINGVKSYRMLLRSGWLAEAARDYISAPVRSGRKHINRLGNMFVFGMENKVVLPYSRITAVYTKTNFTGRNYICVVTHNNIRYTIFTLLPGESTALIGKAMAHFKAVNPQIEII